MGDASTLKHIHRLLLIKIKVNAICNLVLIIHDNGCICKNASKWVNITKIIFFFISVLWAFLRLTRSKASVYCYRLLKITCWHLDVGQLTDYRLLLIRILDLAELSCCNAVLPAVYGIKWDVSLKVTYGYPHTAPYNSVQPAPERERPEASVVLSVVNTQLYIHIDSS